MPELNADPFEPLEFADLRQVDSICLRFEQALREIPRLETYLAEGESIPFDSPAQSGVALFWELLRIEIEYRAKKGECPDPADYIRRFPDRADIIRTVFEAVKTSNSQTTIIDGAQEFDPDTTHDFHPAPGAGNAIDPNVPENFPIPFGEYDLLGYIDGAGQGIIYRAKPVVEDAIVVALKCIRSGVLATTEQVQRFKIEAKALEQLTHSNIIPIKHVGEYKGNYYFTMKLIRGGSLKDKLSELEGDFRASAQLIAKVARAIHFAHRRGILHRDLKPGNILIEEGEPVVIDFGLAKNLLGHSNEQDVICGTINYMPPEQVEGSNSLTTAVDVYSLGAVLYQCLAGKPPYEAVSLQEFTELIRTTDPPAPSRWNKNIPGKLEAICLHCLQRDPEQRYESAEELADDLEHWLADEPVSVCPETISQRVLRWGRKHPYIATLSTVLLLSLVIGTGTVWYFAIVATHALREAEWRQYHSQIDLIHRELLAGNHVAAEGRLATCPLTCRDWEYRYLHRLYQRTKPQKLVHEKEKIVWNLALNPQDPSQLATVTGMGTLFLWKLTNTPKVIANTAAHKGYIWEVQWSPDGKYIATAGEDETVKIWNARTLERLATLKDIAKSIRPAKRMSVRLAAGAIGQMGPIPVLAVEGRELDKSFKEAWSVRFSPKSDKLLTGCEDGSVVVWKLQPNPKANKLTATAETVLHHQHGVWAIEYTRDEKFLVTASGAHQRGFIVPKPGEVRIYDPTTWKVLQSLGHHANACTAATFSPDGDWLVSGGYDNAIHIHRFQGKKTLFEKMDTKRGHTNRRIVSALFSPVGDYFATGSWDKTVKLWDLKTGGPVRQFLGHQGPISGLAFSPDGKLLYTASGDMRNTGVVRIWDWEIQKHAYASLNDHNNEVRDVAFSLNRKNYILASASADGTIKLYDPKSATCLKSLPAKDEAMSPVNCIAFHPTEENSLISGHQDGVTRVWNVHTGKLLHEIGSNKLPVLSVCVSPDGNRIASGYGKRIRVVEEGVPEKAGQKYGQVQVWDWQTRKSLFTEIGKQDSIFSMTFSPDGTKLICTSGVYDPRVRDYIRGCVRAYFPETGNSEANETMSDQHTSKIECVRYTPDGKGIATAGSDQLIQLWNGKKPGHKLLGHTADVFRIAFSPDGKRLASASLDHTLRLWDVSRGQEILSFELTDECKSLRFSPDGRFLAAALSDGSVRLYDSEFTESEP